MILSAQTTHQEEKFNSSQKHLQSQSFIEKELPNLSQGDNSNPSLTKTTKTSQVGDDSVKETLIDLVENSPDVGDAQNDCQIRTEWTGQIKTFSIKTKEESEKCNTPLQCSPDLFSQFGNSQLSSQISEQLSESDDCVDNAKHNTSRNESLNDITENYDSPSPNDSPDNEDHQSDRMDSSHQTESDILESEDDQEFETSIQLDLVKEATDDEPVAGTEIFDDDRPSQNYSNEDRINEVKEDSMNQSIDRPPTVIEISDSPEKSDSKIPVAEEWCGEIQSINKAKGSGWIRRRDNKPVFFHIDRVLPQTLVHLNVGLNVCFKVKETENKFDNLFGSVFVIALEIHHVVDELKPLPTISPQNKLNLLFNKVYTKKIVGDLLMIRHSKSLKSYEDVVNTTRIYLYSVFDDELPSENLMPRFEKLLDLISTEIKEKLEHKWTNNPSPCPIMDDKVDLPSLFEDQGNQIKKEDLPKSETRLERKVKGMNYNLRSTDAVKKD